MIRVGIAAFLILCGLLAFAVSTLGVFRFSTMLNRIHAAGLCDTLAAPLTLLGLAVLSGMTVFSLKMLLIILCLWLFNPASSHLIARTEVMTHPKLEEVCDLMDLNAGQVLQPMDRLHAALQKELQEEES